MSSPQKNKKTLPFELSGNQNSKIMVVFLHGWPDTLRIWDDIIPGYQKDNICLNISYNVDDCFGINFPELINRIKNTIDCVDGTRNLKKICVSFDWGAIFAYQTDKFFPNLFQDHIALDVAVNVDTNGKPQLKQMLAFMIYQVYLSIAFMISFIPFIGRFIANILTFIMACLVQSKQKFSQIDARKMNYPYFYLWFGGCPPPILLGKKSPMYQYKPSSPVVFLYGKNKAFLWSVNFHGEDWIKLILSLENSEVQGLQGGHWIMRDNKIYLIDLIQRRIQRLQK